MADHENTTILSLPLIQGNQAQKHITHNEALRILDALVQPVVADLDRTVPPADPRNGQRHIVAAGAVGDWTGRDNAIAVREDAAWGFYVPRQGWRCHVEALAADVVFDGFAWHEEGTAARVEVFGINAPADGTNRLAVAADATLLDNDGGGHQLKINKADMADTASLLFQTGYGGRAEMGLAGNDDFSVKVSADGESWAEAFRVEAGTAEVHMEQLVLDQQGAQMPLRILNSSGQGASGFDLQFGAEELYTFDVRSGQAPVLREGQDRWIAHFDPTPELSTDTSVVTRAKGDARYPVFDGTKTQIQGQLALWNTLEFERDSYSYVNYRAQPLSFRQDGVQAARIDPAGQTIGHDTAIVTREKGDARYQRTTSSRRFKENVETALPADFSSLRSKSWTWGGELDEGDPRHGRRGYGLLAEDVDLVLPLAVLRDEQERPVGLDSLALIGALFEELRSLRAELSAMDRRLSALEG